MKKRQKEIPGSIVKVAFDEKYHIYARVLNYGGLAFYDCRFNYDETDLETIIHYPIAFKAIVNDGGVKYGRWPIIGLLPLEMALQDSSYYISVDRAVGTCKIYTNGVIIDDVPITACMEMESAAVWSPELIEERIKDHYNGTLNYWAERYPLLRNKL